MFCVFLITAKYAYISRVACGSEDVIYTMNKNLLIIK